MKARREMEKEWSDGEVNLTEYRELKTEMREKYRLFSREV